jgi:translation initiation factor IF-2
MAEWLEIYAKNLVPKMMVEEIVGEAKIMKFFSKTKDKQIVGGKVLKGSLSLGHKIKVFRREAEVADGVVRELQQQKERASEVREGYEFGTMIECKLEIAPGDIIRDIVMVEKQ